MNPEAHESPQRHKEARLRFEAVLAQSGAPGQLHPWHVHAFDSLTPLLNCCRAAGDHAEAISRAHQLVAAMEGVLGPTPSPELGNFLELIGQVGCHWGPEGFGALRPLITDPIPYTLPAAQLGVHELGTCLELNHQVRSPGVRAPACRMKAAELRGWLDIPKCGIHP